MRSRVPSLPSAGGEIMNAGEEHGSSQNSIDDPGRGGTGRVKRVGRDDDSLS